MSKNNMKYWEERQKRIYLAGEKKVNDYYKELKKAFEQAKKEIHSVINDFYIRYAKENKVSFAEAQRRLEKAEIGELEEFIAKVNQHMGEYNLELNNMSIKARITRYQALEKQIDAILQQLYAIEYEYKGKELLKEVYTDAYYRTWFNIDQYHGFHQEFAQIDPRTIEELIKYPWNGASFSDRIWKQKDHMLQVLKEDITTMLIQGKNPQTLVEDFAKRFNTKKYEAYRLLHTESSFIIEQGTLAAYKEDGVEKYQILATLDMKTSDICREQDGKVYDVDKATVGVNYPPFHPFCRTTTVPYYEDNDYLDDTRMARDPVTSKPYEVPANMTYKEWYDKYIENNPEALLAEKKWKNRYADKKQYEKYKEVLGKDLGVKSLDEFQELKYNNIKKWEKLQLSYKDQKLRDKIKSDETIKTIEIGKQGKHIKGHNNYIPGRSYLVISVEELQELINKHAGTGEIIRDRKGKWNNKEVIEVNKDIGIYVDLETKAETKTNRLTIHYSKKGVHVVPAKRR